MQKDEEENRELYTVVLNHEEQYSLWFVDRALPHGWRETDKCGTKDECLRYIKDVWTDMRPLSLRRHAEQIVVDTDKA